MRVQLPGALVAAWFLSGIVVGVIGGALVRDVSGSAAPDGVQDARIQALGQRLHSAEQRLDVHIQRLDLHADRLGVVEEAQKAIEHDPRPAWAPCPPCAADKEPPR